MLIFKLLYYHETNEDLKPLHNPDNLRFLKNNAIKTVREQYSIDTTISKLISLYGD